MWNYLGTYHTFKCMSCDSINRLYMGDLNDPSCLLGEGNTMKCWKCGEVDQLHEEVEGTNYETDETEHGEP